MKKYYLATLFLLTSLSASAGSQTFYYYIDFNVRANEATQSSWVFEKNIYPLKVVNGDVTSAQDKLIEQYVNFVKTYHPEYYGGWVASNASDATKERQIKAFAQVAGYFKTEKEARSERANSIALYKQRAFEDPKNNGPVIEVNEFIFKQ